MYSTPSTALPTESTMNFEDSFFRHCCIDSPDNQQFLRTQPTKDLAKPQAVHTHTRSYDFAFAAPTSFQYMVYDVDIAFK